MARANHMQILLVALAAPSVFRCGFALRGSRGLSSLSAPIGGLTLQGNVIPFRFPLRGGGDAKQEEAPSGQMQTNVVKQQPPGPMEAIQRRSGREIHLSWLAELGNRFSE